MKNKERMKHYKKEEEWGDKILKLREMRKYIFFKGGWGIGQLVKL